MSLNQPQPLFKYYQNCHQLIKGHQPIMIKEYKYCRFKGYKLHVNEETDDLLKTYTTNMHVGIAIGMECRDRDDFIMDIKKTDVDCIWVIPTENPTYDYITVISGDIAIQNTEPYFDKYNSMFVKHGEFACYHGEVFKSVSGINHAFYFKLLSTDLRSQTKGFIMEEPGLFVKMVAAEDIMYAYQSKTFCEFEEKEFQILDSTIDFNLLIRPVKIEVKIDKISEAPELETRNWVQVTDINKIWTKTSPVDGFERFKNSDQFLK